MVETVNVVGAGLAGCEAAYQLAKRNVHVRLYEMKPAKKIPAHSKDYLCELCCSNSFRAEGLKNAVGLLKQELRELDSLIMKCADENSVPAGGALAVDRDGFSEAVTHAVKSHPNIELINKEVNSLDFSENTVVATGPLTSDALSEEIQRFFGVDYLHFYDAAAPIVSFDSIDMEKAYFASRYDKGTPDYINCPMDEDEYEKFYTELVNAVEVKLHGFEDGKVFEGCMPIEVMAKRGHDTMLFGPLKPVGLIDSRTRKRSKAVVQLRKDNAANTLYNMVGFQTHLTFVEQKRVFSLIPGLEHAEFVRYGVMHRNTFINSPDLLTSSYETRKRKGLFFAGQMTGVEGYIESVSSGFVAGINANPGLSQPMIFDRRTAIGALANYISGGGTDKSFKTKFQPMNINFGLIPPLEVNLCRMKKADKYEKLSQRSLELIRNMNI